MLLGVSARTLQGWEQGRKQPSGAITELVVCCRSFAKLSLLHTSAVAGTPVYFLNFGQYAVEVGHVG